MSLVSLYLLLFSSEYVQIIAHIVTVQPEIPLAITIPIQLFSTKKKEYCGAKTFKHIAPSSSAYRGLTPLYTKDSSSTISNTLQSTTLFLVSLASPLPLSFIVYLAPSSVSKEQTFLPREAPKASELLSLPPSSTSKSGFLLHLFNLRRTEISVFEGRF